MKYLDANVLVYAYFESSRELDKKEQKMKEKSREIVGKIDQGEEVAISTVHLSETSNILATCFSSQDLSELLISLQTKDNVKILDVRSSEYLLASQKNKERRVGINDRLAAILMKKESINEIYTFDSDFDKFKWIEMEN